MKSKEEILNKVISLTCSCFNTTEYNMHKKCRDRVIVIPRQFAHYLLYKHGGFTLKLTAYSIGRKDHATAINSVKSISNLLDTDPDFKEKVTPFIKEFDKFLKEVDVKLTLVYIDCDTIRYKHVSLKDKDELHFNGLVFEGHCTEIA